MEDLREALSAAGLTVSISPEKGRCLIATRDFSPGEAIISQEPYVSVPNNSSVSKCDGCYMSGNLKKCSACQVPWYCGSTCQKVEWKLHKLECQALAAAGKDRRKYLTPTIRLMVRLYLKRKLQNEQVIPTTAMDNYNLVEALVDHISDIDEEQLVLYAQMANLVNLILQWPEAYVKEITQNFSKLACNAHTICDSELRPVGTGLYPVVSIINHSCLPNSVLVFEGRLAVVRAIEPISKGTEVCISYIETAGSTATRQKALKEQYLFTCICPCCIKVGLAEDIQESAVLEGYGCANDSCNGFLLRDADGIGFACQKCGHVRNKEEIQRIAREVKSIEDMASRTLASGNYLDASSMYKKIELLQLKLCHSSSINLMRTQENILKILMELQDWSGALSYCRLILPAYQNNISYFQLLKVEHHMHPKRLNLGVMASSLAQKAVSLRLKTWKATSPKMGIRHADVHLSWTSCKRESHAMGIYPAIHPLLGLQYYTCGKLEWLLGDTERAVKSLTKAVNVLRITHGTNTACMKDLLLRLEEAHAEAAYRCSSKAI